jgi:hypothetical protein
LARGMDAEDVRTFCEMTFTERRFSEFTGRHVSPSGIGKKLGLDKKTVRVRVRQMEEKGSVKYYQAIPDFALFGFRNVCSYSLEALNLTTKPMLAEASNRPPHCRCVRLPRSRDDCRRGRSLARGSTEDC